jgi:SAM-dependent methyltransferase
MPERPKQHLMRLARALGLLPTAEKLRGRILMARTWRANRQFSSKHPGIKMPPMGLMHDPYGMVEYASYWEDGRKAADALHGIIREKCGDLANPGRILEWGCGPGRIIRHFPDLMGKSRFEFFGSDYNQEAIEWCTEHLSGISFSSNALAPPLIYPATFFDFIYCISVFTHLSEAMHYAWIAELLRLLKPGGYILISLHGDYYRRKLLPDELEKYDAGHLVVREGVLEGGRTYTAFHGERFIRERLLASAEVLRHDTSENLVCSPQDLWLIRKPIIS